VIVFLSFSLSLSLPRLFKRSKITDDTLGQDEVAAIVNFIPKHVPQVIEFITHNRITLQELIEKSHVFLLKKQTEDDAKKPHPNDVIIKKGKVTNTCILILQGRVKIVYDIDSASSSAVTSPMRTGGNSPPSHSNGNNNNSSADVNVPRLSTSLPRESLSLPRESYITSNVSVLPRESIAGDIGGGGTGSNRPSMSLPRESLSGKPPLPAGVTTDFTPRTATAIATGGSLSSAFKQSINEQILGPWSTLCADSLLCEDGSYAPNFTAYIYSNDLRFVRISADFNNLFVSNHAKVIDRRHAKQVEKQARERLHSDDSVLSSGDERLRMSSTPTGTFKLGRNKTHIGLGGRYSDPKTGGRIGDHHSLDDNDAAYRFKRALTHDSRVGKDKILPRGVGPVDAETLTKSNQNTKSILLASMRGSSSSATNKRPSISEKINSLRGSYDPSASYPHPSSSFSGTTGLPPPISISGNSSPMGGSTNLNAPLLSPNSKPQEDDSPVDDKVNDNNNQTINKMHDYRSSI
jgi:hypothetical protein